MINGQSDSNDSEDSPDTTQRDSGESRESVRSDSISMDDNSADDAVSQVELNNDYSGLNAIKYHDQSETIQHNQIIIAILSVMVTLNTLAICAIFVVWYSKNEKGKLAVEPIPTMDEEEEEEEEERDAVTLSIRETNDLYA